MCQAGWRRFRHYHEEIAMSANKIISSREYNNLPNFRRQV